MYVNNGGKQTQYATAYFGWIKFEMDSKEASLLEDEMKANTQVLRHILIKTTREETRAQLQTEQNIILREVRTTGTIERKVSEEEGGEVSEEEIEKSIDDMVGDEKEEQKEEETKE